MLPLFYFIICFISSLGLEISEIENKFFKPSINIGFKIFGQQGPKNIFETPKCIKLKICDKIHDVQSR